ncbi:MAG TPA: cell division FtsA domain-containing protein [Candidatus Paceibacterota bacterium]|nr:cell division FtsA domain-containing protein [Candidatus Paceibacterota bacterium]
MQKIYTGIDIGTYHVKVVIAAAPERPDIPMQILGTGTASSKGMRHGYIIDQSEATRSIREAVGRASAAAKVAVKSARVAVGGVSLDEIRSTADISLTPSGGIVTDAILSKIRSESEKRASAKLGNRTVIHVIPLEYRLDGEKVLGSPAGLQGTKLSVDTLLITMLAQHYDDLINAVEKADIEVEDVMASPLAASFVTLTKSQKTAGVLLANIGAETLSIIVFDNDIPVSVKVFPVGSSDITNSIALSFQIPLSEAESLKRGGVTGSDIPPKKMETVVTARIKEMFALIDAHLRSIGRQRLLPAGIVITGGGSGIVNANLIARAVLKLPSQTGSVGFMTRTSSVDATWAVAYGLCRWAYAEHTSDNGLSFIEVLRHAGDSLKRIVRSLLP